MDFTEVRSAVRSASGTHIRFPTVDWRPLEQVARNHTEVEIALQNLRYVIGLAVPAERRPPIFNTFANPPVSLNRLTQAIATGHAEERFR